MKLSKKTILFNGISRFGSLLFGFIFIAALSGSPVTLLIITGFMPLLAVSFIYESLYWRNYSYIFEESELKIKSGVFSRNELDIPLKRVQNVDIQRGFFQRLFGIAEVRIETAGADSSEAELRYLELEEARTIQEKMEGKENRREREGEEKDKKEQYQLSNKNLMLLSTMSFSRIAIGFLAALTFFGGSALVAFARDLIQILGTGLFLATASITVFLFFWITSIIYVILRYYRFTIRFRDNSLEFERGLIKRSGGTIPREKIQSVIIEENFLKRKLGYATLKVETAGVSKVSGITGSTVVKPLDTREEIISTASDLGFKPPSSEIENITGRSKKRYLRRYIVLGVLVLMLGIYLLVFEVTSALIPVALLIIAVSMKASEAKWRNIGYSLGEDLMLFRKGFWNRRTYLTPYFRTQNLISSETVFQRRWDLGTVTVDTAGSSLSNPSVPDLDREMMEQIAEKIYGSFKKSF